jgi:sialate O-acetylesterase
MMRLNLTSLTAVLMAFLAPPAQADVRLPKIFADHMVLQQQVPIVVWGEAAPAEEVAVTLADKKVKTSADTQGQWLVELPAMRADGNPLELVVKGKNTIVLKDVLLGEVWLCSGQSNMGRPVDGAIAAAANFPHIRLFNSSGAVPRQADLDDTSGWMVCSPKSIQIAGDALGPDKPGQRRAFSEVAYCFGLKLHQELQVPVGLIQANCGGSTAKDWTPPPPEIRDKIVYDQPLEKVTHQHGLLYWVRVRPMVPLSLRGVVWYQGEDDGRNPNYGADLKTLILSWRALWKRENLPFYFAQIAQTTYAGGMLSVWEGQTQVMNTVPNTGMAVSNDIYDGTANGGFRERPDKDTGWPLVGGGNPHPTGKPRVAERLADIALVKTYSQPDRVIFGPMYDSHQVHGDRVHVKFKHAGSGLTTRDGQPPDWFEVSDGVRERGRLKYVKAEAKIAGLDSVEVWSANVKTPRCARFGWNSLARVNLKNKEGLPAVPFRAEADAPR